MRINTRLALIVAVALLSVPSAVRGELGRFSPQIYGFEGELDIDASYESSRTTSGGRRHEISNTFFGEKLVLGANGFVYHPRFLLFLTKIGGGLGQERIENDFDADSETDSWTNVFLGEYELRALFLPEHPYNLELFAVRWNPYIRGRVTEGIHPVSLSEGALFTYKKKPLMFRLGYTLNTIDSRYSTTDVRTLNANGSYYKENFSLAGGFSHSESDYSFGSMNSEFTSDTYSLQNQIRFFEKKVFLTSDVNQVVLEQRNATSSLDGDRFAWTEQMNMYLPWGFEALFTYNHFKDIEKSLDAGADAERTITSTTDSEGVSVTHKLYESLYTAYTFSHASMRGATGDLDVSRHSLSGTYTKRIPGGRLTAGGLFSRSISENQGAPAVINEVHNAQIFGGFSLTQTDIDETSIGITVRDPDTGAFIDLRRDTHYLVVGVGNTFTITITAVPAEVLNPDPLFVYEFRATYFFISGSAELETTDTGYFLKLELFEGFFNPYYNYSHRDQELLSGFVSGGPEDSTTNTAGVMFQRLPYSLLLEYQDYESRINPFSRYRAEAICRQSMAPTTNLYLRVYYTRVDSREGLFRPASPVETGAGGDITIQEAIPRRNLTLSAIGSYAQRTFVFDTRNYSLGAALSWLVAKLSLNLEMHVGHSETELNTGKEDSLYQRYYLLIRRQLF